MEQEIDNSNADGGDEQVQSGPSPIEQEALRTGWLPEDQFRGDKSKWRPAEEWVERTETMLPIIKANSRQLEVKLAETERRLRESEENAKKFGEFVKNVEERALKTAMEQLRAQRKEAIRTGDADAFDEAETRLNELQQKKPVVEEKPVQQQEHPSFTKFRQENDWYDADASMRAYADTYAENKYKHLPKEQINPDAIFADVNQEMRRRFPEKFGRPTQQQAAFPTVESGNNSGARPSGKRSYERLTPTAKAECDKQAKAWGISKEKWLEYAPDGAFR